MSSEKRPGHHTTVTADDKVIGWIVKRLPITIGADRYPFMAGIPSKYYGFKTCGFESQMKAEKWIRKQNFDIEEKRGL